MPKSINVKTKFAPGTSRSTRSVHTLLRQMAQDAEKLAAQGARIRELRERLRTEEGKRVTQPVVADAVKVTLRAYQEWEAGRGDIKPENVKALADYFGTTQEFIEYGAPQVANAAPSPFDEPDPVARLTALVSGLDEQIRLLRGELAARDAEVMRRLDEGFGPSQATQ